MLRFDTIRERGVYWYRTRRGKYARVDVWQLDTTNRQALCSVGFNAPLWRSEKWLKSLVMKPRQEKHACLSVAS